MESIINYFQAVLQDGDYMNDWITHIPYYLQGTIESMGYLLSVLEKLW